MTGAVWRILPGALLVVLALVAVAPAAHGANVHFLNVCTQVASKGPETCSTTLAFRAAPGELNEVTADPPAAGFFVIRDAGAPLTAGTGCTQLDAHAARCPSTGTRGDVELGDGNDRLSFPAALTLTPVSGDAGNDVITASSIILGGEGDDSISGPKLDGGPGNDVLTGTPGADVLFGDVGDDTIDGGPGSDTVEYDRKPSFGSDTFRPEPPLPVTVDLADPAPDGAAGERDTLTAVENVTASDARGDVLRGDAGPNVLRGEDGPDQLFGAAGKDELDGAGELDGGDGNDTLIGDEFADTLRGGGGDDKLAGREGADLLAGGAGDDLIDSSEQAGRRTYDVDEVRCASGRDRLAEPDVYDRATSCERIAVGGGLVVNSATLVKRPGPRVEVTVTCARKGRRCVAAVATAAASGQAFTPRSPVSLAPGARRRLVLKRFHPGGKARLRRAKVIAFGTKDHGFAVRVR